MDDDAFGMAFNSKSAAAFSKPDGLHNLRYYKLMAGGLAKPYSTQSQFGTENMVEPSLNASSQAFLNRGLQTLPVTPGARELSPNREDNF